MKRHSLACILLCMGIGFSGNTYGQGVTRSYQFDNQLGDLQIGNKMDKSTIQVGPNEIITVSTVKESFLVNHTDVLMVKTRIDNGHVVWSKQYGRQGANERAAGLTLSHNGNDVIVVGSVNPNPNHWDINGLAMRINISTGAMLWNRHYGIVGTVQHWKMVERVSPLNPRSPAYFLVGTTINPLFGASIYAAGIDENGNANYIKEYHPLGASSYTDEQPFDVVNTGANMIISGTTMTQRGVVRQNFTMSIEPLGGSVDGSFIQYSANGFHQASGGVLTPFALSTGINVFLLLGSLRPEQPNASFTKATVLYVLSKNRELIRLRPFWYTSVNETEGLSIYPNRLDPKNANIFLSIDGSAGFVSFDPIAGLLGNGSILSKPAEVISMTQLDNGYVGKLEELGVSNPFNPGYSGFQHVQLNEFGVSSCSAPVTYNYGLSFGSSVKSDFEGTNLGIDGHISGLFQQFDRQGSAENCDKTDPRVFRKALVAEQAIEETYLQEGFSIFPNPVAQNGTPPQLKYSLGSDKQVELSVVNAIGQQLVSQELQLIAGENQLQLDQSWLANGLNFITVRSKDGQVLYQTKVVLQ